MNSIIEISIFSIIACNTYGKFIAKILFKPDNTNKKPAVAQQDGIDYVPTLYRCFPSGTLADY